MAAGADHAFLHWNRARWHFSAVIFTILVTVYTSSLTAGTPCTEGTHTCNRATQLCNDTQDAPGFVCTCINDTQQLSAQDTCVPVPETQRLYLFTAIDLVTVNVSLWNDFNDEQQRKQAILSTYPPSKILSMKTGIFIDMVSISETSVVGKIAFRYSLLFWVNVTSRIKESVARRVLELEAGRVLVFKDIQIPILGYMGIFDTKDQMIYSPKTDTIDWCSSPSLFSCRNHSTCVDYGLRYTCPCKVGYYDNNNNECNLAVRLGGVQEKLEGRLEFYTNGTWRTICQRGFTSQTAVVACRQLGLPSRGAVYYEGAVYGEGTGDVHMYRMTCTGRELALSQCPSEPLASGSCNHSMDVGIRCDKVCVDDYHFGLNCSQPCVCNVSNTDVCDRDNGTCYCKEGWEGVTCDDDVDECAQTGACRGPLERCQNTQGSFVCLCEDEADRNEGGVCTGTDEIAASASSGLSFALVIVAAACSVGVVMIIIIIVIAIAIKKSRARAYAQTTGLSAGSTGYSDLLGANSSYDDVETYDEINDENSSGDLSLPCSTIKGEGQTIFAKPEDGSDGYCSALDDVTSETSNGRKESQEGTQCCYNCSSEGDKEEGLHHDYLHACAATPGPAHSASVADDVSASRSLDDIYLHPVYSLYNNNMASVNRMADKNAGDRDRFSLEQSLLNVDERDDNSRESEKGDYLHPTGSAVEVDGPARPVSLSSPGAAESATIDDDQDDNREHVSADVVDAVQEGGITGLSPPPFCTPRTDGTCRQETDPHSALHHKDSDTYLHPTDISSQGLVVTTSHPGGEESVGTRL